MDEAQFIAKARTLIEAAKNRTLSTEERRDQAIDLAVLLLSEARRIQSHSEKRQQEQLARMMEDPIGKLFTTQMTDQCFRTQRPYRTADQLQHLVSRLGIPKFLSWDKRLGLRLFRRAAPLFPRICVTTFRKMLKNEISNVILPGELNKLCKHIVKRKRQGVRINLNHLGEAILGEEEAKMRLQKYLDDLTRPEVDYVSIKISTICSQINLLAWHETIETLSRRLKQLYRAAQNNPCKRADGAMAPKFVNLDMEEYRDLGLTVELFRKVLDEAEFFHFSAGIVLQAYLPDSYLIQQELTLWAMQRISQGGAPIKIRIVKGANLAMEQLEAAMRGWQQAPYTNKSDVDANYKRMLEYGCKPAHAHAAHIGIASHNLFDIAYAMLLRAENGVEAYITFEMLEGMADHLRRAVQALVGDILLYCPAADDEDFQSAIAYLVRRLDENTAPENFLRHIFDLLPGTKAWQQQVGFFSQACHRAKSVGFTPLRTQNRAAASICMPQLSAPFENEADSDWALPQNRKWIEMALKEWSLQPIEDIPIVIDGQSIHGRQLGDGEDPSFPGIPLYRYALACDSDISCALDSAAAAQRLWQQRPCAARSALLAQVAQLLRQRRALFIAAMIADTAKAVVEGDSEVSEAIDFVEFYRRQAEEFYSMPDLAWHGLGTVVVAPPWNFSCAIAAGGIAAALAAGNSVLFKPAPEAVLVGWHVVNAFWDAGIDKKLLQFVPCLDEPTASSLVADPRTAAVILTGATNTAKLLMRLRPDIHLLAETGGKNSIIVTSMADRDLAIKDIIHSAFSYSGQKCSACSLLILEDEVYNDSHFLRQLRDAAASLRVGAAWDASSRITPLIREASPALTTGLTTLEEGEYWLLQPLQDSINPNLWHPGIKMGVTPKSFTYRNELFGPVLAVLRAADLDDAIALANGTPYGLTAGLHSLDDREQKLWLEKIEAGNCYVNRTITGAIVRRQPFGGCKESCFGYAVKAGGPNYLLGLMKAERLTLPAEALRDKTSLCHAVLDLQKNLSNVGQTELWHAAVESYAFFWKTLFIKESDPSAIPGQNNILRYVAHRQTILRVQPIDTLTDVALAAAAAATCGAPIQISAAPGEASRLAPLAALLTVESDAELSSRLQGTTNCRIRFLAAPASTELLRDMAEAACNVIVEAVQANGRVELMRFLREISISSDYHRYGYLGDCEGAVSL